MKGTGPVGPYAKANLLFWSLLAIWAAISVSHWSYTPIWDGWSFFTCYLKAGLENNFDCFGHTAYFHTFLFGLTQKLFPHSPPAVYFLNLVLAAGGIWCFREWLSGITGERLEPRDRSLLVFAFAFTPVFLAHTIQPCLDFPLPPYECMLLLALQRDIGVGVFLLGILMSFTKETGCLVFGLMVTTWTIFGLPSPHSVVGKGNEVPRLTFDRVLFRGLPLVLFALVIFHSGETHMGSSWADQVRWIFRLELWEPRLHAQLTSLFILNFHWLASLAILAGFFGRLRAWKARSASEGPGFLSPSAYRFTLVVFLGATALLTRVPFVNNPRYLLPAYPFFFILAADGAAFFLRNRKWLTTVFLAILIGLEIASCGRTIDPASRYCIGAFRFGDHEILQMAALDHPPRLGKGFLQDDFGHGRDQLSYNFQFTHFASLTDGIIAALGTDRTFVFPFRAWFREDFSWFDPVSKRHRYAGPDAIPLRSETVKAVLGNPGAYPDFCFIALPNFDRNRGNAASIASLSQHFDQKEVFTFSENGYSIAVHRFIRPRPVLGTNTPTLPQTGEELSPRDGDVPGAR